MQMELNYVKFRFIAIWLLSLSLFIDLHDCTTTVDYIKVKNFCRLSSCNIAAHCTKWLYC